MGKRRRGCPSGGVVVFSAARADKIPHVTGVWKLAHVLGVRLSTVQQWADLKQEALPFWRDKRGRRQFARAGVIAWLKKTGRIGP